MPIQAYPASHTEAPSPTRPTTRPLWWATCIACVGLILFRLPATVESMRLNVAEQLAGEDLDPALVNLSVKIAAYLGVILFSMVMIVYLGFAAFLERKLLPHGLSLPAGQSIGVFCLLVGALTLTAQTFAYFSGSLPSGPLKYLYVLAVAASLPMLYRRHWKGSSIQRIALLFTTSLGLAALVALV